MNTNHLLARVQAIPLFANCGQTSGATAKIASWEEWAGPEEPRAMGVSMRMQHLHDLLIESEEEAGWKNALRVVVGHARSLVPYIDGEDAHYAPNIAVWECAWVFSLEEVHRAKGLPLPDWLRAQIQWYEQGHWPCELVSLDGGDLPQQYVVY